MNLRLHRTPRTASPPGCAAPPVCTWPIGAAPIRIAPANWSVYHLTAHLDPTDPNQRPSGSG
jgi:hypothetical protein